jgi:hypothetical protein
MKQIKDLTKDDCQMFLNEMFDNSVEFVEIIFDGVCIDECGIKYKVKSTINDEESYVGIVPFSNPDIIIWLYKNDIDINVPLKLLKIDFIEMDETNATLFQYAMSVNNILNEHPNDLIFPTIDANQLDKIRKIQKELISKI